MLAQGEEQPENEEQEMILMQNKFQINLPKNRQNMSQVSRAKSLIVEILRNE